MKTVELWVCVMYTRVKEKPRTERATHKMSANAAALREMKRVGLASGRVTLPKGHHPRISDAYLYGKSSYGDPIQTYEPDPSRADRGGRRMGHGGQAIPNRLHMETIVSRYGGGGIPEPPAAAPDLTQPQGRAWRNRRNPRANAAVPPQPAPAPYRYRYSFLPFGQEPTLPPAQSVVAVLQNKVKPEASSLQKTPVSSGRRSRRMSAPPLSGTKLEFGSKQSPDQIVGILRGDPSNAGQNIGGSVRLSIGGSSIAENSAAGGMGIDGTPDVFASPSSEPSTPAPPYMAPMETGDTPLKDLTHVRNFSRKLVNDIETYAQSGEKITDGYLTGVRREVMQSKVLKNIGFDKDDKEGVVRFIADQLYHHRGLINKAQRDRMIEKLKKQ